MKLQRTELFTLNLKAKVPLHRIRGCCSTRVPSFWFSGHRNDQQIILSEVPKTVFKKIQISLGHFSSFEMEASPFAFSSEHFWHSLLGWFFFSSFHMDTLGHGNECEFVSAEQGLKSA